MCMMKLKWNAGNWDASILAFIAGIVVASGFVAVFKSWGSIEKRCSRVPITYIHRSFGHLPYT